MVKRVIAYADDMLANISESGNIVTTSVYGPKRAYVILVIFEVCIKSALAFRSRSRHRR